MCPSTARTARRRTSLVRQLALAKLRELRREGLSYLEIGRRFRSPQGARPGNGRVPRVPAARILVPDPRQSGTELEAVAGSEDAQLFLRALDALDQGIAFFDADGEMLCANRPLAGVLEESADGPRVRAEVELFAAAAWRLALLREVEGVESVEEMAIQDVPGCAVPFVMKASYIGLDLLGRGPVMLISVERQTDPLAPEVLRLRFALTDRECTVAQLLAAGRSNGQIAETLTLSPHTARRHTENILRKIDVRSRTEAVVRLLSE